MTLLRRFAAFSLVLASCMGDDLDEPLAEELQSGSSALCATVSLSRWRTPVRLSTEAHFITQPDVAISANGTGVAAWIDVESDGYHVRAARYAGGPLWPSWQLLSDDIGAFVWDVSPFQPFRDPRVAIDASGNAMVIWVEYVEGNPSNTYYIKARRIVAGNLQPATTLATHTLGLAVPEVAIAGGDNGDVVAVWTRADNNIAMSIVHSRYSAASNSWSAAAELEIASQTTQSPVAAAAPDGTVVVAWKQGWITLRRILPSGTLEPSLGTFSFTHSGTASAPNIAMNGSAEAVISWKESGAFGTYNMMAGRWKLSDWIPAAQGVSLGTMIEGTELIDPSVDIDNNGNVLGVFHSLENNVQNIYTRRQTSTGTRDPVLQPLLIDTGSRAASLPVIEVGTNGSGFAMWQQPEDMPAPPTRTLDLRAARLTHQAATLFCPESWTWSTPRAVASSPGIVFAHDLAVSPSGGGALAVWMQESVTSGWEIYAVDYR